MTDPNQSATDAGTGTPETDAATKYSAQIYPIENEKIEAVVRADFARSLETRLAAALAGLEKIACMSALAESEMWQETAISALRAARAAKSEGGNL